MSKVEFVYGKGGKKVMMASRTAEALRRMGHGDYPASPTYQTRMLKAATPDNTVDEDGPLISEAVALFAQENGVDLTAVKGTGLNGRIKKSDVEAVIQAQGLV